jgi:hypothetical protein
MNGIFQDLGQNESYDVHVPLGKAASWMGIYLVATRL